jgi:hypothetical protein
MCFNNSYHGISKFEWETILRKQIGKILREKNEIQHQVRLRVSVETCCHRKKNSHNYSLIIKHLFTVLWNSPDLRFQPKLTILFSAVVSLHLLWSCCGVQQIQISLMEELKFL